MTMTKRKTSKAPKVIKIPEHVFKDPVFRQIRKLEIMEPEYLTQEERFKECDEIAIGIMKAISGHHRDVIAGSADTVLELFVRRKDL